MIIFGMVCRTVYYYCVFVLTILLECITSFLMRKFILVVTYGDYMWKYVWQYSMVYTQWFDIVIRLWWHVKPCMHACSKVIIFLSVVTNKTSKRARQTSKSKQAGMCVWYACAYLLLKLIAVQGPNADNFQVNEKIFFWALW